MSASHGCNDDTAVVESFKEALLGRVGTDRFQMWFENGVEFAITTPDTITATGQVDPEGPAVGDRATASTFLLRVRGQFALDRLRKNFMQEIRGAAMQATGTAAEVQLCLLEPPALQTELPLGPEAKKSPSERASETSGDRCGTHSAPQSSASRPSANRHRSRRRPKSIASLIPHAGNPPRQLELETLAAPADRSAADRSAADRGAADRGAADQKSDAVATAPAADTSTRGTAMTAANFVAGSCNQLAHTAMAMACQDPSTATPLFLCGPTGTGKTHLMAALAEQFRRRHRMRRVMHLSAEQFTNDFISSVGNSGITAFRRRYRDVDALLVDDVQFLGAKKATLREMLYTVETLATAGRPLVFSGLHSPTETEGLLRELAGRMAAGLVCSLQPLDAATREVIFRRWLDQRCPIQTPDDLIQQIVPMLAGDGRVISGVVNVINTLQRMYGRVPSMDQVRQHAGDLLRASRPVATMSVIESAVCDAFHLPHDILRGGSQTRAVTGPRMLAMYLSRQLTSSAYAEIARHFGGKSHSTAISAENNVKSWLETGKPIGRGHKAMSAQEAIDRVEALLRSG